MLSVGLHGAVHPDLDKSFAGGRVQGKLQPGGSEEREAELASEVVATANHAWFAWSGQLKVKVSAHAWVYVYFFGWVSRPRDLLGRGFVNFEVHSFWNSTRMRGRSTKILFRPRTPVTWASRSIQVQNDPLHMYMRLLYFDRLSSRYVNVVGASQWFVCVLLVIFKVWKKCVDQKASETNSAVGGLTRQRSVGHGWLLPWCFDWGCFPQLWCRCISLYPINIHMLPYVVLEWFTVEFN